MKAQELRIENYVSAKSPEREKWEEPYIIGLWDLESLLYHKERINIKPIPLTEEWLKKFGFEYDEDELVYYKSMFDYCGNESEDFILLIVSNDENYFSVAIAESYEPIEYVHQLQNLYFALTGEELTLKK